MITNHALPEEFENIADILSQEFGVEKASSYMNTLVIIDDQDYE